MCVIRYDFCIPTSSYIMYIYIYNTIIQYRHTPHVSSSEPSPQRYVDPHRILSGRGTDYWLLWTDQQRPVLRHEDVDRSCGWNLIQLKKVRRWLVILCLWLLYTLHTHKYCMKKTIYIYTVHMYMYTFRWSVCTETWSLRFATDGDEWMVADIIYVSALKQDPESILMTSLAKLFFLVFFHARKQTFGFGPSSDFQDKTHGRINQMYQTHDNFEWVLRRIALFVRYTVLEWFALHGSQRRVVVGHLNWLRQCWDCAAWRKSIMSFSKTLGVRNPVLEFCKKKCTYL